MKFEQFIQKITKPLSADEQMQLMGQDMIIEIWEIQKLGNIAIHPEILDVQTTEVLTRIQQQILMIIRGHRWFLDIHRRQSLRTSIHWAWETGHIERIKMMEWLKTRVTEHMSLVTLIRILNAVNKQLDLRENDE